MHIRTIASVGLLAIALAGSAFAAPYAAPTPSYTVNPGESVSVLCDTGITIEPVSSNEITARCAVAPAATATSTATAQPSPTTQPTTTPTVAPTATTTATPAPTAIPATPVPTPSGSASGMWISRADILALPMSGTPWANVKAAADGSWGSPNLSDLNSTHDVLTLAGALVYVRTGNEAYRAKVANAIMSAIGTEAQSRALEVSRNIQSYVISAELIDFKTLDPTREAQFRSWLSALRTQKMTDGKTIISSHEGRPNNWGTHAGASRIAAAS